MRVLPFFGIFGVTCRYLALVSFTFHGFLARHMSQSDSPSGKKDYPQNPPSPGASESTADGTDGKEGNDDLFFQGAAK
jgi:hypothetical protein